MAPINRKLGFTLIEMSIVIAIIGLIIGGVLVGQDLIRISQIRSTISQIEQIRTAMNTFRVKYNCVPGDCSAATNFFGTDSLGCPAGGGDAGTCNGDGNGVISDINYSNNGQEVYRGWQQMGTDYANLIPGKYTGISGPLKFKPLPDINSPRAKIREDGVLSIYYLGSNAGSAYFFPSNYQHTIELFAHLGTDNVGIFIPSEAYAVDQKMDDGLPAFGSVMGQPQSADNIPCSTTSDPLTARYDTADNSFKCGLIFKLGF